MHRTTNARSSSSGTAPARRASTLDQSMNAADGALRWGGGMATILTQSRRPHPHALTETQLARIEPSYHPRRLNPAAATLSTWGIFALVYLGLAVGRLPFLHLDRAGIALVGATGMLVLGLIRFDTAVSSVDFETMALLFGMMVVVAYLRLGGFFRRLAAWLLARARSPHGVLAAVVGLAGVLSAFLVNDVVCLALGPVAFTLARRLRRDPVPYLVALATAANVGSTATITGNPQNMIIGALSHIPYVTFASRLAPVALVGLVVDYAIVALVFRRSLARELEEAPASVYPPPQDPAGAP